MIFEITPNTEQAYKLLHKGTLALARAERQGMRIDMEYCEQQHSELSKRIEELENDFRGSPLYKKWEKSTAKRPNIHSNSQLAEFLYGHAGYKPTNLTASGKGSTDEKSLESLDIKEINGLLYSRKLKKIRDTYLGGFMREQVNGFMHPVFNLHTVRTFRSSSNNPNFQNIPKRNKEAMKICRRAIYPREGHQLMEVDFGSLEVRIAACYHEDPTMLTYIQDKSTDMHGDMAEQIFIIKNFDKNIPEYGLLRSATKNGFVFPQFYGDYYKNCAMSMAGEWGGLNNGKWKKGQGIAMPDGLTLSDHLISKGIKSMDDFIEHVRVIEKDFWGKRFPVYAQWKEKWWEAYQKKGSITMHTGFTCRGLMQKNDAINYPVQGAAFHCLLWCFIRLDEIMRERKWKTRLIGQIHDAIVLDIYPPELEEVKKTMTKVLTKELPEYYTWINVPLEVDADLGPVDASWNELEKCKL